jgi:hypothetical protein
MVWTSDGDALGIIFKNTIYLFNKKIERSCVNLLASLVITNNFFNSKYVIYCIKYLKQFFKTILEINVLLY